MEKLGVNNICFYSFIRLKKKQKKQYQLLYKKVEFEYFLPDK